MKETLTNTIEQKEQKEYSFEEGVVEVERKIEELLQTQQIVVVGFESPYAHVGKSATARRLHKDLSQKGIYVSTKHDLEDFEDSEYELSLIKQKQESGKKIVIIFDELKWAITPEKYKEKVVGGYDKDLKRSSDRTKFDIQKVDLWVGICRPDKPFPKTADTGEPVARMSEITINNEFATDK